MSLFKEISPFIRFGVTQSPMLSAPDFCNVDITAYDHRIFYCIEGSGNIYINNIKYELKPYSILIWNSGLSYRINPKDKNFTCYTVNFDYFDTGNNISTPIKPQGNNLFNPEKVYEKNIKFEDNEYFENVIYINDFQEAEETVRELVTTYRQNFNFSKLFLKGITISLFKKVLEKIQKTNVSSNKENIYEIVKYIHDHYKDNISNEDLAKLFNFHPNYLSTLFLENTGTTLHKYIIKYRLSRALKLLVTTNMSLGDICDHVNIKDQHYFSRIFKKYYGVPPSKFKQKL